MKNQNKTRRLTVSSIYQPRTSIEDKNVPMINLIGLWVENAGFKIGDKVSVDVEPNRILVNRIEPVIIQEAAPGNKKRKR